MNNLCKNLSLYLPANLRKCFENLDAEFEDLIVEITIGIGKPAILYLKNEYFFVDYRKNRPTKDLCDAVYTDKEDIRQALLYVTDGMPYSFENSLSEGFITLKNGCRVGVCGDCYKNSLNKYVFRQIYGLTYRISRDVVGCSKEVMKYIDYNMPKNTLIISPPCCGKTTLLKDIARELSLNRFPMRTIVIDERYELSPYDENCNNENSGIQLSVISGIDKPTAFNMAIRSLSPNVIITDELGSQNDVSVIEDALKKGVKIIASVHGKDITDIKNHIYLSKILKLFEMFVIMSDKRGEGKINKIYIEGKEICFT